LVDAHARFLNGNGELTGAGELSDDETVPSLICLAIDFGSCTEKLN